MGIFISEQDQFGNDLPNSYHVIDFIQLDKFKEELCFKVSAFSSKEKYEAKCQPYNTVVLRITGEDYKKYIKDSKETDLIKIAYDWLLRDIPVKEDPQKIDELNKKYKEGRKD